MIVRFHPAADDEALAARNYYEQASPELGDDFVEELAVAAERVTANPTAWGIAYRNLRRCSLDRFPFWILYRIRSDEIQVVAVAHEKRKPFCWLDRL